VGLFIDQGETVAAIYCGVQPSCFFSRAARPGIDRGKTRGLVPTAGGGRALRKREALSSQMIIKYTIDSPCALPNPEAYIARDYSRFHRCIPVAPIPDIHVPAPPRLPLSVIPCG
jgi:hypothetical protein